MLDQPLDVVVEAGARNAKTRCQLRHRGRLDGKFDDRNFEVISEKLDLLHGLQLHELPHAGIIFKSFE
jgi:hypothetical protein